MSEIASNMYLSVKQTPTNQRYLVNLNFMKQVSFKMANVNSALKNLLTFYCNSGLDHNCTYDEMARSALKFIDSLKKEDKDQLMSFNSSFTNDHFDYPAEFSKTDIFDFNYGFENFFITVKNVLDNYLPDFIKLKTERQASPPIGAYDEVGHNKEVKVKKMNYSYLFD